MKRILFVLTALSLLTIPASAMRIIQASNGASWQPNYLPSGGLPPGGLATFILEDDFGLADGLVVKSETTPLTTTFAGVSVQISAGGMQYDALPIVVVGPNAAGGRMTSQVSAVIPSNTPEGEATVVITGPAGSTPAFTVVIRAHSVGLFALNLGGSGPGVFTDAVDPQKFNTVTTSFEPGALVDIWATGLTPVTFSELELPVVQDLRSADVQVEVYVGGELVELVYAGRTGCCISLDLLRIRLKQNMTGCYVPLVVVVNGIASNVVTISINEGGGACSDPNGLTSTDISNAQAAGGLNVGTISLNRSAFRLPNPFGSGTIAQTTDQGSASFRRYTDTQLFSVQSFTGLFAQGSCIVIAFPAGDDDDVPDDPADLDPVEPILGLDAGPAINVMGPNGARVLDMIAEGSYRKTLGGDGFGATQPLYLGAGTYNFDNGNGGADIGPFMKSGSFPDPLTWTNRDQINSIMSGGLPIMWSGGQGTVVIFGASFDDARDLGAGFYCQANASAGQFTVPGWVIDSLPPSDVVEGFPTGLLAVGNTATPIRFDAPNLDVGHIIYSSQEMKNVGYHIDVPDPGTGGGNGGGNGGGGGGTFAVSSTSWTNGGAIPVANAFGQCGGQNISPELTFANPPAGTEAYVVVMQDPDAGNFLHWVLTDIPGSTTSIPAGNPGGIGVAHMNDFGATGYGGPCPPSAHQYTITVYAMPTSFGLPAGQPAAVIKQFLGTLGQIALGTSTWTGTFTP